MRTLSLLVALVVVGVVAGTMIAAVADYSSESPAASAVEPTVDTMYVIGDDGNADALPDESAVLALIQSTLPPTATVEASVVRLVTLEDLDTLMRAYTNWASEGRESDDLVWIAAVQVDDGLSVHNVEPGAPVQLVAPGAFVALDPVSGHRLAYGVLEPDLSTYYEVEAMVDVAASP